MTGCPIHFDPLSPEQLADPYPLYARLRREAPVFYDETHDLWVVTRYDDVLAVVRDTETYSSKNAVRASVKPLPRPVLDVLATGRPLTPTLTDSDGDVHRRLRLLIGKAFTPERVAAMEVRIQETVDALIDEFAGDGRADIIERFAWNLPLFTITDILNAPREDVPALHPWSVSWLRIMQATDGVEELVACAEDVGKGIHACLGAPLARLQLQIALPRLFERLPNLRIAAGTDAAVRDTIFFARGFKKLEIEWDVKEIPAV